MNERDEKGGPRQPRNHPGHERAILALWVAMDALEELAAGLREAPEAACTCRPGRGGWCPACRDDIILYDAEGVLYALGGHVAALEGEVYFFTDGLDPATAERFDSSELRRSLSIVERAQGLAAEAEADTPLVCAGGPRP